MQMRNLLFAMAEFFHCRPVSVLVLLSDEEHAALVREYGVAGRVN